MPYFKICPTCGAHLDPGETCDDCRTEKVRTNCTLPADYKKHALACPPYHSRPCGLSRPISAGIERSIS